MSNKSKNNLDSDDGPDNHNQPPTHSPGSGNRVLELLEKHKRDVQERMTNRENAFRDILVRELARRLERERSHVTLRNCEPNPTHSSAALDDDGTTAPAYSENTFRHAFDEAYDTASTEVALSSRASSTTNANIPPPVDVPQALSKSRMQREKDRRRERERVTNETSTGGSSQSKRRPTNCEPTSSTSGRRTPSITVTASSSPTSWRDSLRLENIKDLAGIAIIMLLTFGVLLFAFYVRPSGSSSAMKGSAGGSKEKFWRPVM